MANVLNRLTKEQLYSVNTGDYQTADWIINPNLSAVSGIPSKYWKITGDVVSEMSQEEKEVVDYPYLTGLVVVYDPDDPVVANRVVLVIPGTLLTNFDEASNVLQDPVLPNNVPFKYMKVSVGALIEMTSGEKDDVDGFVITERDRSLVMHDIYTNASSLQQMSRLTVAIDPRVSFIVALDAYNYALTRDIMVDMYAKDPNLTVEDLLHVNKYVPTSMLTI